MGEIILKYKVINIKEITEEILEKMLEDAYNDGYRDGENKHLIGPMAHLKTSKGLLEFENRFLHFDNKVINQEVMLENPKVSQRMHRLP